MLGLSRSGHQRVFAGVCGGLAEAFGVAPIWIRGVFLILAGAKGLGLLLYLVLALVMSPSGASYMSPLERLRANLGEIAGWFVEGFNQVQDWVIYRLAGGTSAMPAIRQIFGGLFLLAGLFALLYSFDLFGWLTFWRALAIGILLLGIALLVPRPQRW